MDLKKLSEPLTVDQIDFRVQSINKGGYATILAYKDARVDMQRLDDAVGPLNWKREHTRDNHNCIVSLWDYDKEQWVPKEDTGKESSAESEKGLASDSFKRACFNWGIGKELYDYPVIQVKLRDDEWTTRNDKPVATWKLRVKDWIWSTQWIDGKLVHLTANDGTSPRFEWGEHTQKAPTYTEKQREEFLSYLASGDSIGLRAFVLEVGNEVMDALFNSAPQGQKTRFKQEVRDLYGASNTLIKNAVAAIQEAIEAKDYSAIEEIYSEMDGREAVFIEAALTDIEKRQITDMKEAA